MLTKKTREFSELNIDFSELKNTLTNQFEHLFEIASKTDYSFTGAVKAQQKKQIDGIENLEKIATDLSGHPIKILTNVNKSNSPKQTIAEYQEFMIGEKIKEKKQNAIESPQVKKVLSVFKNSKIDEIKLPDD